MHLFQRIAIFISFILFLCRPESASAQSNLLLNGGFEDINVCSEYKSECGVEAWFYLKDVKAQMLENEAGPAFLGKNSFAIFFNWLGYKNFSPVVGTILPCRLQKNSVYKFKGSFSVTLNAKLLFNPGIAIGERFYVPNKNFSTKIRPDSIVKIRSIPSTNFYEFEYSFTATGEEKYLTFGTYIREDTSLKFKIKFAPTVSLVIDNFQLIAEKQGEVACNSFDKNKEKIYNYDFRHKEMDYSLFTKGELLIKFEEADSNYLTRIEEPKKIGRPDTLKLGDVYFDFNKANLKPGGISMLEKFFQSKEQNQTIDSIYIEGHTDSIGSNQTNLKLSFDRSKSVESWFLEKNILPASQIQIHSFGKTRPIASNKTSSGRAMNRRVELIIFRQKGG
jgi:outer membrane protein OmpA-like peptidoglycan-associated protein